MASLLYSSCSILKTCCTHHIIAPHLELFSSKGRNFTHNMGPSDKQFTPDQLSRNYSTRLWSAEALRWTGQQQDEVERVTGGGKGRIVFMRGKKPKDPSRTFTWATLRYCTLQSFILIFQIAKETPLLILKVTISSVPTRPKLRLQEWVQSWPCDCHSHKVWEPHLQW